jgi:hypothetical protein
MTRDETPAGAPARKPRIDLQAFERLTSLADYFVPFMIRSACELGIADELREGPRRVDELATATNTHAPALHRVLRALASKGVFAEVEPGRFASTPLGDLLRSDHPLSLRDAYIPMAADVEAWLDLEYSLQTGKPAFEHVHGQSLWQYLAAHPDESVCFDRGMQAMTRPELRAALAAYDWQSLGTVVDVGGGNGAFLAGLLARIPALRGVLVDLPRVTAGAHAVLEEAGVADRCEIVSASFFDGVPPGGDAYFLKRIVYSWDDERALSLLRNVRAAMGPNSVLLVCEPVVAYGRSEAGLILDVVMLVVDGGRARTVEELSALFAAAGLELTGVLPTMVFPIVEAVPA